TAPEEPFAVRELPGSLEEPALELDAERPGMRFDRLDTGRDSGPDDLFRSLARDAVDVPEILAMVERAHQHLRDGARDAAEELLARAAQAYDAASDVERAARVYRVVRDCLPASRTVLMQWFD